MENNILDPKPEVATLEYIDILQPWLLEIETAEFDISYNTEEFTKNEQRYVRKKSHNMVYN